VIMAAFPLVLWALSAGPNSGKAGVPGESTCTEAQCHVGTALNGGGGSVKVTFPGGTVYAPGVKQHLVVTIADPTARNWGFQLTARLASDTKTQVILHLHRPVYGRSLRRSALQYFQDASLISVNQNCPAAKPLAYVGYTQNGSSRIQTGP
jgi:hypothetical protein